MDGDDVEARLEAVERALADGETDLAAVTEAAEYERTLDELRERVDELESQVTDLTASVQAVRGYVGNVRTVNRDVERRADAALAKVEELARQGTDRDDQHPPEGAEGGPRADGDRSDRPMRSRRTDERTGAGRRDDERAETPGDIARRITDRGGSQRGHRPTREGSNGDGGRRQRGDTGRRSRSRDRGGTTAGSGGRDDEGGFLAGLRDAL
jgi:hypothetical protein